MSDPQVWTLIGVFAAAILGGFSVVITSLSRVIRAEIGGLRNEMRGEIAGLRGELAGLNARFDHVDRDVQGLTDRFWRGDRDA